MNYTLKLIIIFTGVFFIGLTVFILKKPYLVSPLASPECKKCNVILVSVDTLGAKHLGLYGYDRETSPFLDEFSKERGVVFDNAIAQAPWTLPSHAAMLTSQYPAELGVWTATDALPAETKTIAEVLKEQGFTTQAFSNGAFVQPEWGFDQGFDGFSGSLSVKDWDDVPNIFRDAIKWVTDNDREPFFLFIRSFHVHDPYTPSEDALLALGETETSEVHINDIVKANTRAEGPTKEDAVRFSDLYDGEIRELDEALSEFFQGLDRLGLLENTMVIITADHGEEFGEHGTAGFHVALYEETIHVPLIFFIPNAQARRVAEVVEIRTLPPTIVDVLGLEQEPYYEAESAFSHLTEEKQEGVAITTSALERDTIFRIIENAYANIEQFGKTIFPKPRVEEWENSFSSSARSARWHLIRNFNGTFELYDVMADPGEQNNLFPSWTELPSEDRREALVVLRALGSDVPIPCGIYCPSDNNDNEN